MAEKMSPTDPGRRRRSAVALLLFVVLASLPALAQTSDGFSSGLGGPAGDTFVKNANGPAGCGTSGCHSGADPNPRDEGVAYRIPWIPPRYEPDSEYELTLTFQGGPSPGGENQGGFLVWVSNGTFPDIPENANYSILNGDSGEGSFLSHNTASNDQREWTFVWKAPPSGTGDAFFRLTFNSVNGDGSPSAEDRWNRIELVSLGERVATEGEVDISKLGVPLKAYWLGTLGFVSVFVTVGLAYLVMRGTSRHHKG